MRTTEHGIESSRDVEDLHRLRLMALLQELVREKGYKGAARVLEIDPQTASASANRASVAPGAPGPGEGAAGGRRLGGGAAAATHRGAGGADRWVGTGPCGVGEGAG